MEGIGFFSYEMTKRMVEAHPEVEFHLLFDRTPPPFSFVKNVTTAVLFPPARHPFLWWWWFEGSVTRYLRNHAIDLFLSHDGFVPLRSKVPTVAVQHDIAFEHYPGHVGWLPRNYYRYYVPRFLKHAARIATVSEFSKNDMVANYGVEASKIDVVYNAPQPGFGPATPDEKQKTRVAFTQSRPYFFYVGSINPRKNLANMLRAFEVFKSQMNSDMQFVIGGAMGWQNSELQEVLKQMQHRDAVIFTGRLSAEAISRLMAAATAFLYVSLFEGFGVPPLEAMSAGVPVITSNVSSLPEVCGDAALYANPQSVQEIAKAMQRITGEKNLAETLVSKGFEQTVQFSLGRSAALLWESVRKALG